MNSSIGYINLRVNGICLAYNLCQPSLLLHINWSHRYPIASIFHYQICIRTNPYICRQIPSYLFALFTAVISQLTKIVLGYNIVTIVFKLKLCLYLWFKYITLREIQRSVVWHLWLRTAVASKLRNKKCGMTCSREPRISKHFAKKRLFWRIKAADSYTDVHSWRFNRIKAKTKARTRLVHTI